MANGEAFLFKQFFFSWVPGKAFYKTLGLITNFIIIAPGAVQGEDGSKNTHYGCTESSRTKRNLVLYWVQTSKLLFPSHHKKNQTSEQLQLQLSNLKTLYAITRGSGSSLPDAVHHGTCLRIKIQTESEQIFVSALNNNLPLITLTPVITCSMIFIINWDH